MNEYRILLWDLRVNPCSIRQIPARCPLFSSLDRANDYAHSPIVAPLSPPRLSRALRTHTNAQSALFNPGMSMVRSPLSLLSFSLSVRCEREMIERGEKKETPKGGVGWC